MVKAPSVFRACLLLLPAAALVLVLAATLRSAEYDEQYTLFLTGEMARPPWTAATIRAGVVSDLQSPTLDPIGIARTLQETDVHPPLYFWAIAAWRTWIAGDLLATRLFSVGCSLISLVLVGVLAHRQGVHPLPAMMLTLGSYGFVYTGGIARGFAMAIMLVLVGAVFLVHPGRPRYLAAGIAFGAACCANYLAVFVPLGLLGARALVENRRFAMLIRVGLGMAPFLAVDHWFFLAQRAARPDQFPPFDLLTGLSRLARYLAASMLGGLPLYVPQDWTRVVGLTLAVFGAALIPVMVRGAWRHPAMLCAALASPLGLLALGAVFNNTPIELRYLSFSVPFVAILLAAGLPGLSDPRHHPAGTPLPMPPETPRVGWAVPPTQAPAPPSRVASIPALVPCFAILAVQATSLAGLMLGQATMQPARATARAAAALIGDGVTLVPFGNDGVGIVGAFGIEAPPGLRLTVVRDSDEPMALRDRISGENRVVIATIAQDDASRATIPQMFQALTDRCWRRAEHGFNVVAFERICPGN